MTNPAGSTNGTTALLTNIPLFRQSRARASLIVGTPADYANVESPQAQYSLAIPDPSRIGQTVEAWLARTEQYFDVSGFTD